MATKKDITTERKADSTWNSFGLTVDEASRLGAELADANPDEDLIYLIMMLVKSLVYTRDHTHREHMLYAVERPLMHLTVASTALNNEVAECYRRFVKEGGAS